MRTIRWQARYDGGCLNEGEFHVDDSATAEEIEAMAQEEAFDDFDWSYEEVGAAAEKHYIRVEAWFDYSEKKQHAECWLASEEPQIPIEQAGVGYTAVGAGERYATLEAWIKACVTDAPNKIKAIAEGWRDGKRVDIAEYWC